MLSGVELLSSKQVLLERALQSKCDFPRSARVLKKTEFPPFFLSRLCYRSCHFKLYLNPSFREARLGTIVGKKVSVRAITRNLVRRLTREVFRNRRSRFFGFDVLLWMQRRFDKDTFISASSTALKMFCRLELEMLFEEALTEIIKCKSKKVH